jgi:hypothetical protein
MKSCCTMLMNAEAHVCARSEIGPSFCPVSCDASVMLGDLILERSRIAASSVQTPAPG